MNQILEHAQLLIHTDNHELETRANPDDQPSFAFEDSRNHVFVPRLGSEDLVALAFLGRANDLSVRGLTLCDHRLQLLDDDTQTRYSAELLTELKAGNAKQLTAILNTDLRGIYVCGVDFYSPTAKAFTIRTNGSVTARNLTAVRTFLTKAFRGMGIL